MTHARAQEQFQATAATYTLDQLAEMSIDALTAVYEGGSVPESMSALDGSPTSRMLTIVGPFGRGPAAEAIRRLARSRQFPWAGKSFQSASSDEGAGVNRVRLAGERQWFPFDTRIEPSAMDGAPCIVLDYDKPENPWAIRKIHDELREVSPGLFLGPAMAKTRGAPKLLLFFSCDFSGC